MTTNLVPELEMIAADRRRGAAEVADKLITWGERWIDDADTKVAEATSQLIDVARSQAALAPVLRVANDFLVELERREEADETATREGIAAVAGDWRKRMAASAESVRLHLCRAVEGVEVIYTYSASSTIRRAIETHHAAGNWFQVIMSESRPGSEGSRMAAGLAERGVLVKLGIDAWLWSALEDEGALLLGADALLPGGWVNKIGSRALAARAADQEIDVIVAADTSKRLPPGLAGLPRVYDRDPAEIVF
ncbi:MAG: hypothetical protein P8Y29_12085, partial [Gemmatimonadota bacterium]